MGKNNSWLRKVQFWALFIFIFVTAESISVRAKDPTLPVLNACFKVLEPKWNKKESNERRVWEAVCKEEIAELADDRESSTPLDTAFVRDILTKPRYLKVIPSRGVWIKSARFKKKLNLNTIEFPWNLAILQSIFEDGIKMRQAKMGRGLILTGSRVIGPVWLEEAVFEKNLLFRGCPTKTDPCDTHSKSGKPAVAKAEFQEIDLSNAKIGKGVSLVNATVSGKIIMKNTEIGGNLSLQNKTEIQNDIDASFATINGSLNLYNSSFTGGKIDLTGVAIGKELALKKKDASAPSWGNKTILILRNARASYIKDMRDLRAWPSTLELNGFEIQGFSESLETPSSSFLPRATSWYTQWLERDPTFTVQPYLHLASILRNSGEIGKADNILFKKSDEERKAAWRQKLVSDALWLEAQKWLIGFGYRVHWASYWIIFVWLLGIAVLRISRENIRNGIPWGIAYSLDMLLPVIKLRDMHYEIDLSGWARYYFYAHKLAGYVLVGFLAAGLSGLTS